MQRPSTIRNASAQVGVERRLSERLQPDAVMSSIGPVLDLSAGGMRALCVRPFRGEFDVCIEDGQGEPIDVRASVKWRQRIGFRRFVVGIAFVDVTPPVARRLLSMGKAG